MWENNCRFGTSATSKKVSVWLAVQNSISGIDVGKQLQIRNFRDPVYIWLGSRCANPNQKLGGAFLVSSLVPRFRVRKRSLSFPDEDTVYHYTT